MPDVISNSSPLQYLYQAGILDLLHDIALLGLAVALRDEVDEKPCLSEPAEALTVLELRLQIPRSGPYINSIMEAFIVLSAHVARHFHVA